MNSVIENKLFELITKEENFEFAYDINERFESIQEKLYSDFFTIIQKNLKEKKDGFIIENTNNYEFVYYHKTWKLLRFYFNLKDEFLEIGIGGCNEKYKSYFSEFAGLLQMTLEDFESKISEHEFWFYYCCEDDLESLAGLKKILPTTRDILIEEYLSEFDRFFNMAIEVINKCERKLS